MKRGWIGLALLVVLLASSLFTAKKMEEYHNDGTQMLTQAGTCALEENWAAARELAFQAMKQWQKHREFTAAFADHEPMEDVDCLFAELPVYAREEDAAHFAAICAELSKRLEAVSNAHSFLWWNVL